jgi:hypothetical protein
VDDLTKLSAFVTEFAAQNTMTLVPAVPERDLGSEVNIRPDTLDLHGFLALAAKLGGGVLYSKARRFDPEGDDEDEVDDPPSHLLKRKGEIAQVSVAFAVNGLIHFWEQRAPWYDEWQALAASQSLLFSSRRGLDDEEQPERLSDEERARLAGELADKLLAMPEFRAAKPGGARQRFAKLAIPADTDRWVGWDATRDALDRAEQLAQAQYAQITERLDDLAAELLASPAYQQASSPGARKQAAEQFLIPRADGFSPPAHIRDEMYARARDLAKAAKRHPTLL